MESVGLRVKNGGCRIKVKNGGCRIESEQWIIWFLNPASKVFAFYNKSVARRVSSMTESDLYYKAESCLVKNGGYGIKSGEYRV